jgi:5-methylcytosine-specific restriction endonuclease McrBC regulatory subunit McrC
LHRYGGRINMGIFSHDLDQYEATTRWRQFEKHVNDILTNTTRFRNYKIVHHNKSSSTGKIPDYYLQHKKFPNERIVLDAKWCKTATNSHIEQMVSYKKIFHAGEAILIYPENAEVSDYIYTYASTLKVDIYISSLEKRKERKPGALSLFKKKEYRR